MFLCNASIYLQTKIYLNMKTSRIYSTRRALLAVGSLFTISIGIAFLALALFSWNPDYQWVSPASSGPGFLYSRFNPNYDEIYFTPESDWDEGQLLTVIEHSPNFSIVPAEGIVNNSIAFLVKPPGNMDTLPTGELWLLDLKTGKRNLLASDPDIGVKPIWTRDGTHLMYRRVRQQVQELVELELSTQTRTVYAVQRAYSRGLFPLGEGDLGSQYYVEIFSTGVFVSKHSQSETEPEICFKISDTFARDFSISPDGQKMIYLQTVIQSERLFFQTYLAEIDCRDQQPRALLGENPTEQYSPIWSPIEQTVTIGTNIVGRQKSGIMLSNGDFLDFIPLPPGQTGFDVPIVWSHDEDYLLTKSFDGLSSANPGYGMIYVIDRETGMRYKVDESPETRIFGWWSNE